MVKYITLKSWTVSGAYGVEATQDQTKQIRCAWCLNESSDTRYCRTCGRAGHKDCCRPWVEFDDGRWACRTCLTWG